MKRTLDLAKRVQPLADRLAQQLGGLLEQRVEAMLGQVEEAFEIALSAYASGGSLDLLTAALGPELAGMLHSSTTTASAVEDGPRPTKRSKRVATPGQSASSAAGNVAEPHRVPTDHRDADADVVDSSSSDAPRRICGCAARGPHRRACSLLNVSASPSSSQPPGTPAAKVDRFARIEAAAAARRALGSNG